MYMKMKLNVKYCLSKNYPGFCIIHISLKSSKAWEFETPKMWTFYIFERLKANVYEPNIGLIRLMLIMQNSEYLHVIAVKFFQ